MMRIEVLPAAESDRDIIISDMQNAFQAEYETHHKVKTDDYVLPIEDIEELLNEPGNTLYKAVMDGKIVGAAIVYADKNSGYGMLGYTYVRTELQDQGIGTEMWKCIEKMHPEVKEWEVHVWVCDSDRTLPFYTRKCGFKLSEFYENLPLEERGSCWPLFKRMK